MLCLLSALLLCLWCVALKYAFICDFKGVFSGFWVFGVGLYCFGALRGLWGFCVREWLGGLKACCVFAFLLSFCLYPFAFRFISLPAFCPSPCLLCSGCLLLVLLHCLCGSLGVVVVSFSLAVYTQKRAQFSCVLSCPVMCV